MMGNDSYFTPASSLSIEALADLYTATFDDYFYPIVVTADEFASRIPAEQLLLDHSPLLYVDDDPVGLALLALRGARSCCGGFGIVPALRGRGLALPLTLALLAQARQCGARHMALIVLTQNERAIKTYRRAGFTIWREVWCFEWAHAGAALATPAYGELVPAAVPDLLALGPALQPVSPIWQRDAATLGALAGLAGLALLEQGAPVAYLLMRRAPDRTSDILAIGARSAADAASALAALQRQGGRITCFNEPADSPGAAAMVTLGFARTFRRYEMVVEL
jgi:RimJ/RimL family protein N-acetyltransferase